MERTFAPTKLPLTLAAAMAMSPRLPPMCRQQLLVGDVEECGTARTFDAQFPITSPPARAVAVQLHSSVLNQSKQTDAKGLVVRYATMCES
jgi:hypothetical protein